MCSGPESLWARRCLPSAPQASGSSILQGAQHSTLQPPRLPKDRERAQAADRTSEEAQGNASNAARGSGRKCEAVLRGLQFLGRGSPVHLQASCKLSGSVELAGRPLGDARHTAQGLGSRVADGLGAGDWEAGEDQGHLSAQTTVAFLFRVIYFNWAKNGDVATAMSLLSPGCCGQSRAD